jgi:hypothetical protein
VRTLLEGMDITGALVTADTAHTCADTARYLVQGHGADYLLTIKRNRPSLQAPALAAGRNMIAAALCHVRKERGHGRTNRWTTWATDIDEASGFPHEARLALIRRDVADLARQPLSKEIEIARVMATLHNLSLGLFAIHGITKAKETVQVRRCGLKLTMSKTDDLSGLMTLVTDQARDGGDISAR